MKCHSAQSTADSNIRRGNAAGSIVSAARHGCSEGHGFEDGASGPALGPTEARRGLWDQRGQKDPADDHQRSPTTFLSLFWPSLDSVTF